MDSPTICERTGCESAACAWNSSHSRFYCECGGSVPGWLSNVPGWYVPGDATGNTRRGNGHAGGHAVPADVPPVDPMQIVADAEPVEVLSVQCAADIEMCEVSWLWPARIPLGKLSVLAGDAKLGKSLLTLDIAARVSRGTPWPDARDTRREPGGVILFSAEDDPADTVVPRLHSAAADLNNIVIASGVKLPQTEDERAFRLDTDIRHLEALIKARPDTRLVVIDPVTAYIGDKNDCKNSEMRGLLAPFASMAARHGVAILAVSHMRKAGPSKAIHAVVGSLAFAAAARAVWAVVPDPDNRDRRLLLNAGMNLAADPGGLAYVIRPDLAGRPVVQWEDGPVAISADDAMARNNRADNDRTALDEAVEWLRAELSAAPLSADELRGKANVEGFSPRTLARARKRLGVKTVADRDPESGKMTGWKVVLDHNAKRP